MNSAYICPNRSCTIGKQAILLPLAGKCTCGTIRSQVAIIHLLVEEEGGPVRGSIRHGTAYDFHPKKQWGFCCETTRNSSKDGVLPRHYTTSQAAATCQECLLAYRRLDKEVLQKYQEYCNG